MEVYNFCILCAWWFTSAVNLPKFWKERQEPHKILENAKNLITCAWVNKWTQSRFIDRIYQLWQLYGHLNRTRQHYATLPGSMDSYTCRPVQFKERWGSPLFQTPANKECTYCSLIPRPTQLSIISSIFHSHGESLEKKLHLYCWEM